MATDLREPFARNRDEAHPVRWSPADGDTPAYLTLKGAVERLEGYGYDAVATEEGLRRGTLYRTPFAFYMIDDLALCPLCGKPSTPAEREECEARFAAGETAAGQ